MEIKILKDQDTVDHGVLLKGQKLKLGKEQAELLIERGIAETVKSKKEGKK